MNNDFEGILDNVLESDIEWTRPPKHSVCVKEVVELFVNHVIYLIQSEEEVPKFNILFSDDAINYFYEVAQNPFKLEGYYTPDIKEKDIKNLSRENQNDVNYPTILVKDYKLFFELLIDIINEQITLNYNYGEDSSARRIAILLMKRIWLRMGPDDFENVELFLQKQLDFLKSMEFDKPLSEQNLKIYEGNQITYSVEKCETWCETTRRMHFRIYNSGDYHDLPEIYYDIREENREKICYIYAVQMGSNRHRIKNIERNLYKLNKGNSPVHPNFVMAMKLFYELLDSHGINHIKVPVLQVLSHRYHTLLSNRAKREFEKNWTKEKLKYLSSIKDSNLYFEKREYKRLTEDFERDKIWYSHVVEKEDFISKNKTERLINLFMHMAELDGTSQINTIPFENDFYLDVSLTHQNDLDSKLKK